jgi:mRNA-degrading endonuclease toxin of MazEF toxin-antitoxin module
VSLEVKRGTVVMLMPDPVGIPPIGHEQGSGRPAVVVSDPAVRTRYPMFCVVPLTRTPITGDLYPTISPSKGSGLSAASIALTSDIRGIDPTRIRRIAGTISPVDLGKIEAAIRLYLRV